MEKKTFYFFAIPILALCLCLAIYNPSLDAPFQLDDLSVIRDNTSIKTLSDMQHIWFHDPSRFLTHLTFAFNYHFGGLNTRGYHIVNLSIHLLVAFVFFVFLRIILTGLPKNSFDKNKILTIATSAAFIFLCHPIQTSAVTYLAQRSTLLAGLSYLSSIVFYVLYRRKGNISYYFSSIIIAAFGLFTKPIVITLPLALLLYEICFLDFSFKGGKKVIFQLVPFLLMSIVVPLLLVLWKYKYFDLAYLIDVTKETTKIQRGEYLLTQFNVLVTYIRLLILPIRQNLDYDYPIAGSFFAFPTYLSFCVLVFIAYLAFWLYRRERIISFCIFWFFLTLSLESSVFPISDVIFEHRLYLPMIGFAVILPVLLVKLISNRPAFIGVMCFIVVAYSVLGYRRNDVWRDRVGFLLDMISKSPGKARPHNNLATVYLERGDLKNAEIGYKIAIALENEHADAHNNLGTIYRIRGKTQEAINYFKRALELKPNYAAPYYNLASIYSEKGDLKKAEENYRKAIEIKKYFASAYVGLADINMRQGRINEAKFFINKAVNADPDYAYAYLSAGDIYLSEGNLLAAVYQYEKAIEKKSDLTSVYNNIANIYDIQGNYTQAIEIYKKVLSIDPQFSNAYFNMSNTLKKLGRLKEAKRSLMMALNLYKNEGNDEMFRAAQKRLKELN